MKKGISFILICAYLFAAFQFTVPFLSYYANYTYFSTEACINKHNLELECNGQCQLKEMVAEQHSHDASEPGNAIQIQKISSSTIFFYEDPSGSDFYLNASLFSPRTFKEISSQLYSSPSIPPPQLG